MGDYILFSDQKTVPSPDALFWMIKAVTEKKADMIYTDEDEVSTDGKHHYDPKFKPDFNLFRLRENNYIGQFWAIRRDVLEQSGKFRPEYDGAQNFDMILRCCEQAKKIVHIPRVLCHCMENENGESHKQQKAWEAGRRALEDHYNRTQLPAVAEPADKAGWYRTHLAIQSEPMISIIIPSKLMIWIYVFLP